MHRIARRPGAYAQSRGGPTAGLPASLAEPALAAAEEVERIVPRRRFDLIMGPLWDLEPCALLDQGVAETAVSLHTTCAQLAAFKPEWNAAYRRSHVDKVIAGERRLLQRAPHVLANTRAAVRDIAAALDLPDLMARTRVIAHGLPDLAGGVLAPLPRQGLEVLFVGRLELRKGVDVLLSAAPWILAAAPDVRITLIGEDVSAPGTKSWRERFLAQHSGAPWRERIHFEGPLPRVELLSRYAACDVVVVPSRYESFGLTALEAMIFAKPCVAGDAGGLPEVVADKETGLLVAPGDATALAVAVLHLACQPDLRRAMGEAGRRRYEARFTADAMALEFEAWARSLISAGVRIAAE